MTRMRFVPLLAAAGLFTLLSVGSNRAQEDYDIHRYGQECARLIAEIPPFNCLDGEIIPITVNGKTPETYMRHMQCDKPAYLPYPEKIDGQCAPYTRLRAVRDDDIQMLLCCRRRYSLATFV